MENRQKCKPNEDQRKRWTHSFICKNTHVALIIHLLYVVHARLSAPSVKEANQLSVEDEELVLCGVGVTMRERF